MRTSPLAPVLLLTAASLLAEKPFTLEQVLSNPFPESLVAAPAGGSVAWQMNARGARNVWVASPPDYRGHPVTHFFEDNGQDINQLRWAPDGRSIVFVRGGDFDMGREAPNPRSNPEGVEQALWTVSLDGGEPRKLGEGHDPAISPKGDRVAFLSKGQIWWAPLDGHDKAAQAVHARGTAQALRWSPDGLKLAFVSSRGDHAFIGVFDPATKSLRYVDPAVDQDAEPVWSPDSRQIAFIRIPASHDLFAFGPRIAAEAWSIRIADITTGAGHEVWRAAAGRGSVFYPVVAERQLLWANGRLLFPWERTGWIHLYSVPVAGGDALELTPGDFEVEHVTLSPGSREAVFSSNQADIDRRHVWKVAVDRAVSSQVTTGEGIEWSPAVTSGNEAIVFLHSDARRPPRAAIIIGAGAPKDLALDALPADFPADQLVAPQAVTISAADGLRIHGQLFLPHNLRTGERRPALIFFHGGSQRQMLLGWHYMYYYSNAYAMNQYLASLGYIVLSVNYRSGIGYGLNFREALHYGRGGASEFNDVLGAGNYLRGRPDVDPAKIGAWGGSYGGFLTALALARASNIFAAGVDMHGVHEWQRPTNWRPSHDPDADAQTVKIAWESSPMASIAT